MPTGNLVTFSYAGVTKEVIHCLDLEDQIKSVRQKFPIPADVEVTFFKYQLQLESQIDGDAWRLIGEVSKVVPIVIHIREGAARSLYLPATASGNHKILHSTAQTQTQTVPKVTTTLPTKRKKTPRAIPSEEEDDDESLDDAPVRPTVKRKLNPPIEATAAATATSTIRIGPPNRVKWMKISNTKLNIKNPHVTTNTKVGPPTTKKPKPDCITISPTPSPQPQPQPKPKPKSQSAVTSNVNNKGNDSDSSSSSESGKSHFWHNRQGNHYTLVESAGLSKRPCSRCKGKGIHCRRQSDNRINGKGRVPMKCFECRRDSEKCSHSMLAP